MSLEAGQIIDVSLGVSELLPPLCLSHVAATEYRDKGVELAHMERLAVLTGLQVPVERVVFAAGASQGLLAALLHLQRKLNRKAKKIVTFTPQYPGYRSIAELAGLALESLPHEFMADTDALFSEASHRRGAIWLINSPHNPTGRVIACDVLAELACRISHSGGAVIWDAAYLGVADSPGAPVAPPDRIIIVGSFSKLLGIAGERVGFVAGPQKDIDGLARAQWGLGLNAPAAGMAMARARLDTLGSEHFAARRRTIADNRTEIVTALKKIHVTPADQPGPFLWCQPDPELGLALNGFFQERNVAVAPGDSFGASPSAFRINLMIVREKALELVRRIVPS